MLEIKNLKKSYNKEWAVNDVSFRVESGKIGVLLGPNGAGKSTIIKSISGLLRYEGEITIGCFPARSVEAKRIFAYVPELPSVFNALTVREHIEYIRRAYKSSITDQEVEKLLERFEMLDKQDKLGVQLSKGMMQKVSICCALCVKPEVILLDEPMVGLDPAAIKELKAVIRELKEAGSTILISTHMLEMVKEIWDHVFIMDQGKLVGSYANDGNTNQNIEELFFGITKKVEEGGEE